MSIPDAQAHTCCSVSGGYSMQPTQHNASFEQQHTDNPQRTRRMLRSALTVPVAQAGTCCTAWAGTACSKLNTAPQLKQQHSIHETDVFPSHLPHAPQCCDGPGCEIWHTLHCLGGNSTPQHSKSSLLKQQHINHDTAMFPSHLPHAPQCSDRPGRASSHVLHCSDTYSMQPTQHHTSSEAAAHHSSHRHVPIHLPHARQCFERPGRAIPPTRAVLLGQKQHTQTHSICNSSCFCELLYNLPLTCRMLCSALSVPAAQAHTCCTAWAGTACSTTTQHLIGNSSCFCE
jgi:hypothetical protein